MKALLIRASIVSALLLIGFATGRVYQNARNGYHYQVLEEESRTSPLGTVRRKMVMETIGYGFLDSGTSIIELNDVTLFKTKRWFQENHPVARHLTTDGNTIRWDDGKQQYHLTIEPLTEHPDKPAHD